MKRVSVSYAKSKLRALLQLVRHGQTVTITDRGVPVATLGAAPSTAGVPPRFIERAKRGLLKLPDREPTAERTKRKLPRPKGPLTNSAVDALIEERRTER